MGYKAEIQNINFDGLIPALEAGNLDVIISGMTINDERKKKVDFSDPYYKSGLSIIVAAGFQHRDGDDFPAVFLQGRDPEKLPGAESDEGKGDIWQEGGALHHGLGYQVQDKRPAENTADDVGCHIRQTEFFGHPGHQKPGGEHQGDRDDCNRYGRVAVAQPIHPDRHGFTSCSVIHRWYVLVHPGFR